MAPLGGRLLPLILAVAWFGIPTHQRGDGAPAGACVDMTPSHSGIPADTSNPPYVITVSAPQVHQGGTLMVSISSPSGVPIGGFLLQAREVQNQDKIIGKFLTVPNPELEHIQSCRGDNDSVTHSTTEDKRGLTFEWQAPSDYLGAFFFRATVAKGYAQFWKNVESSLVEVVTADTTITTTSATTTTRVVITPPPFTVEEVKSKPRAVEAIYQGCDETKLCFGSVSGCVARANCPALVAVLVQGDIYTFELQAEGNPAYVAAGLSSDGDMGDDSAMECQQVNGKVTLHSSWTYPKVDPFVTRVGVPQDILRLISSSYADGKLYCKFTRDVMSTVMNVDFDLANGKYILMIVAGDSLKEDNRVGFHNKVFEKSGLPLALAAVGGVQGASKLLLRLHGAFMLLAWLGTSAVGILLARYFKQTWVGKTLGGKDIWFAWHRILMVLTWLLTITAFVLIVVEVGGWSTTGDNPHAITGLCTVLLCFLQPIGAYFRPHPGTSKRVIFNWLHWLAGNLAHILGIVSIFFACYLNKAELPSWSVYLLVGYVAFHVVMHLVLSLAVCVSEGRVGKGRVNTFPMKDLASQPRQSPGTHMDRKTSSPHSGFRKCLLGIYAFFVALFVIAMVCLVSLAPIQQTYQTVVTSVMGETP